MFKAKYFTVSLVFGHEEESMLIVKKLVSLGCDVNVEDIEKKTPLFLSAFVGNKGKWSC